MMKTLTVLMLFVVVGVCTSCGFYGAMRARGNYSKSLGNQIVMCSFTPSNKDTFSTQEPLRFQVKFTESCMSAMQKGNAGYDMHISFCDESNKSIIIVENYFNDKHLVKDVLTVELKSPKELGVRQGKHLMSIEGTLGRITAELGPVKYRSDPLLFTVQD